MECDEEPPQDSPIEKSVQPQLDSAGESCADESGPGPDAFDEEAVNGPSECEDLSNGGGTGDHAVPEPKVGMAFESEKAAYDYYSEYGRKVGFCIRWDTRTRSRITGETISRRFLCNKQGFRVDRQKVGDLLAKYHREETRCGCKAFMRIKLGSDGKFHVSELYNTHNHELVITQKVIESKIEKKVVVQPAEADYRNFLKTKGMSPLQRFEAGRLLDYFISKQAEDPSFFYSFQLDDDERITNVFWADGKMKADYVRFGDVWCFDTMYRTSDYGQPLALFVGVNHHMQIVLFGSALLCDETADSLRWVFKAFREAMCGKMPDTIYTDGDKEIADAVELCFPGSSHRLCAWHLYQNALKHLGHALSGFADFDEDFRKCIFDSDIEADFLKGWSAMLQKYGLSENTWLQQRFEEREKWAAAYGRTTFSAEMKNAWRFDNLTEELGTYLNCEKDILIFLGQFDRLLAARRNEELEASVKMTQSLPYAPPIAILQHAARVYTPAVFKMFMAEHHEHLVTVNITQEILTCSCHKFELAGILCGHIMNCILHDLRYIPEIYILKRWTRGAGSISSISQASASVEDLKFSLPKRYNCLAHDFIQLSLRAAEDEDMHNCAMKHKLAMYEEMEKIVKEKTSSVRIISSGSMFGGSQARNSAIGEF
ncbi:unnamed protein product [Spirodela intermedia]|uniref:Protein FAR1-RELATED SEQUENCE n=1 Tax=Spirodela intermedia TaxID=51605 RepID=A0A7I8IK07_SPIIN|nr:unnamed protein product [Spirodela intermedia]CAA6658217.1 unnamed protein product [Spirodela intermedia]